MRTSAIALILFTVSCSSKINWPKVLQCAEPVAEAELSAVQRILAGNGDTASELGDLAASYAPATIECAVQQIIADLSAREGAARDDHALARGREFLAKVTQ